MKRRIAGTEGKTERGRAAEGIREKAKSAAGSRFALFVGAALAVAAGVWLGIRAEEDVLPALFPLVLAVVAARLVSPAADAMAKSFHIGRRAAGAVLSVTLCALALWLLGLLGTRAAAELETVAGMLPEWIGSAAAKAEELAGRLPFSFGRGAGTSDPALSPAALLTRAAGEFAGWTAGLVGRAVQGFPGGLLSLAVGVVSFVYLTADPGGARDACERIFCRLRSADEKESGIFDAFERVWDPVSRTLRALLVLEAVAFGELLAGFWLLKVGNAPAVALLTAFVDLLPLLGCGAVLVPWAAAAFLSGRAGFAAGLLVLLAAVWVTRQMLEPKLIGAAAGVHPFFALAATYLGLRFFGLPGLFAAPVLLGILAAEKKF